jgi:hypothetical protein
MFYDKFNLYIYEEDKFYEKSTDSNKEIGL